MPYLRQAERRTRELLEQAAHHFSATLPAVEIRFDLKGRSAGMVRFSPTGRPVVRYNEVLLAENREHFINQTIPHEVAHVVVMSLYGRKARPHGREWRSVMGLFGAEPARCHQYDTSRSVARHHVRYPYRCGCREHQLTAIRRRRMAAGQQYYCRGCGEPLQPVDHPLEQRPA